MTTKWTQNQALSGDQQEIFDYQTQRNADMAYMAAGKGNQIQQEMSQPLDWQQFGDVVDFDPTANRQRAEDDAYGRSTQRLDSQFDSDRVKLERQMSERGLRVGDSAYDSAMNNFSTGRNDAYEMARMGATAEGRQEDQQSYGQAQGAYGMNRQAEQQRYDQQSQSVDRANALRDQKISEYLSKRGQGLKEANALSGSMNTAEMSSTYGGGGE